MAKVAVGFAMLTCAACRTSFEQQAPELVPEVDGGPVLGVGRVVLW